MQHNGETVSELLCSICLRSYLNGHRLIGQQRMDINVINLSWKQTYQSPVKKGGGGVGRGNGCRIDVSHRFNALNTLDMQKASVFLSFRPVRQRGS